MSGEMWAAMAGAVIGAAMTGIVAYCLQRQVLNAQERQRAADKLERQQGIARSIVHKISLLYTHAGHISKLTEQVDARIAESNGRLQPFQAAPPFAPIPNAINFTTDEVTLPLALRLDDLFNDVANIDERHNNLLRLAKIYSTRRLEFNELIVPASFTGATGHHELVPEQALKFQPRIIELNQLVEAIKLQSNALTRDSWKAVNDMTAGLNAKLGLSLHVTDQLNLGTNKETGGTP